MIIKKFQANTETEAILKAKEEMGSEAVVLNIKTTKHRGFARLFKNDTVEVTAALEEKQITAQIPTEKVDNIIQEDEPQEQKKETAIEEKLNNLQQILENQMQKKLPQEDKQEENKNLMFIKLIYNQLLDSEVDEKYANQIVGEIQTSMKKEASLDSVLSSIYQKLILKLGEAKEITIGEHKKKLVFFVGPTGVGKTTTIAKLASYFKLQKKAKVGMITSDTYRIAAVEQLKTYANILDVPLKVIYTIEEFNQAVEAFKEYDLIFVDTAGRSHKNKEQCMELLHLIQDVQIDSSHMEKEVYVVLSVTTKYKDLIDIINVYKELKGYRLIFTKLDETNEIGNILNIKFRTGAPLSYVTSGQAVPDDIMVMDAQKLAKQLLGGKE